MGRLSQAIRLITINRILVRHGLDEIIFATHLFRPFRFLLLLNPRNWLPRQRDAQGVRLRRALEELGPIFIKFGQMLSTRRDMLPDDIADELALLVDRVKPFASTQARHIIEVALGQSINTLFADFNDVPLASASIAQVHEAILHDGRKVIVKIVRPHIKKTIRRDIALLYIVAQLAQRFWSQAHRLHPVALVAEYEKTLFDELDLVREAANACELRRNFEHSDLLYIPKIEWPYCHKNVLVMERIKGIPVSDITQLKAHGVNLKALSERGVEVFFT